MTATGPRWLAVMGLTALGVMVLQGQSPAALIGAAPLAVLIAVAVASLSHWAIAAAVIALPYFCYGVMEVLTNPAGRTRAVLFSALAVLIFFAALDALRRQR